MSDETAHRTLKALSTSGVEAMATHAVTTSVGRLARRFGLSRTALLYYDRIGLLHPSARSDAGYRLYTDEDAERLRLICSYRRAGLTLAQIQSLLESPGVPDEAILTERLRELDREIGTLRVQQRAILAILESLGSKPSISAIDKQAWVQILRASGLDEDDMMQWHRQFESDAPDAHHAFLLWLGIPEEEAREIRARSKRKK